jgi:uncharacterized membrane protein
MTLSDLFHPAWFWMLFFMAGIIITYGTWSISAAIMIRIQDTTWDRALKASTPPFLILLLLTGTWLKHVGVPVGLFYIPAFGGFFITTLWIWFNNFRLPIISRKAGLMGLIVGMVLFAVVFSILGALKYLAFRTFVDFAIFVHQLWGFTEFTMVSLVDNGLHPLGNHFSPILFLFTPIYWLWTDPILIYCLQNVILALGALPIYWLAKDHLKSHTAAMLLSWCYLLYPALQQPATGDFHESHLIATPFLFAFYFLQKKSYVRFALFAVLTLMCKEDATLLIGMCGFYIWIKNKHQILGSSVMVFSALWLFISVFVIMPYYGPGWELVSHFFNTVDPTSLGSESSEASSLLKQLLDVNNITFILQLLIPLAGIAVLAPLELALVAPMMLELIVYTGPPYGMVGTIYTWHVIAVIPGVFIAAVYGLKKVARVWGDRGLVLGMGIVLVCSILCNVLYGVLPFSLRYSFADHKVSDHDKIGHDIIKQIPPDVSVSTTSQMSAHLAHRNNIYIIPQPWEKGNWRAPLDDFPEKVDYVVVDTSLAVLREMLSSQQEGFIAFIHELSRDPDYFSVDARDGYVIFKRKNMVDADTPTDRGLR